MSGAQRELPFRFVAPDAEGKSGPIPQFVPETGMDRRLAEYAMQIMQLGKDMERAVAKMRTE